MAKKDKNFRIYIDKRGNWFQDGLKITHRWTYLENNKNLDIDEDGNLFVDEGTGRVYVEAEDTPFVVKMVNFKNGILYAVLNDESVEKLKPENIGIGEKNVPYTTVKNSRFDARFSSQAYYELAKHAVQDGDDFYLDTPGGQIKIRKIEEQDS